MAFSPFEGVLLDDPREPIPGSLAVLLHLRVEWQLAGVQRRPRLSREAILDRSKACQELLRQGLSRIAQAFRRFAGLILRPIDPAPD